MNKFHLQAKLQSMESMDANFKPQWNMGKYIANNPFKKTIKSWFSTGKTHQITIVHRMFQPCFRNPEVYGRPGDSFMQLAAKKMDQERDEFHVIFSRIFWELNGKFMRFT